MTQSEISRDKGYSVAKPQVSSGLVRILGPSKKEVAPVDVEARHWTRERYAVPLPSPDAWTPLLRTTVHSCHLIVKK